MSHIKAWYGTASDSSSIDGQVIKVSFSMDASELTRDKARAFENNSNVTQFSNSPRKGHWPDQEYLIDGTVDESGDPVHRDVSVEKVDADA